MMCVRNGTNLRVFRMLRAVELAACLGIAFGDAGSCLLILAVNQQAGGAALLYGEKT